MHGYIVFCLSAMCAHCLPSLWRTWLQGIRYTNNDSTGALFLDSQGAKLGNDFFL